MTQPAPSLSQRLKEETAPVHERMHELVARAQPFASRANYAKFVAAQYLFQREIAAVAHDAAALGVPHEPEGLARDGAALQDLADLGAAPPAASAAAPVPAARALGWLYVSEGSTLGAAFLLKEAREKLGLSETFGARHLAAHPEGRAAAWRRFTAWLDEAALPQAHDEVVAGANDAFRRFGALLSEQFPEQATEDAS